MLTSGPLKVHQSRWPFHRTSLCLDVFHVVFWWDISSQATDSLLLVSQWSLCFAAVCLWSKNDSRVYPPCILFFLWCIELFEGVDQYSSLDLERLDHYFVKNKKKSFFASVSLFFILTLLILFCGFPKLPSSESLGQWVKA